MKHSPAHRDTKSIDRSLLPDLPPTWAWSTLERLASSEPNSITDGPFGSNLKTSHYTESGPRVVRLQNIGDGEFVDEYAHISDSHFRQLVRHHVRAGDVVIAALGETLPRSCVIPPSVGPALVKADCPRFRPNSDLISAEFANYALNSPGVRRRTGTIIHGVGRPRLNLSEIRGLWLPVAPRGEQDRIVAKLDELFSDLDAGVAALERAQANLKRYRAAVLKAAVEGKLTEQWRAEHPDVEPASELLARILNERRAKWEADKLAEFERKRKTPPTGWREKYVEPTPPVISRLTVLPQGWCWATVEQLSQFVRYGSSAKTSEESNGVPVLRMGNIVEGNLDLGELKYLPHDHDEFPLLLLESGDLLFNRTNSAELVGKTAVYRGTPSPCSFASYLIAVRYLTGCDPDFVSMCLNSTYGRRWVASVVSQQVGQANVNGTKLQAFTLPLPPIYEQEQLVALFREMKSQSERAMVAIEHGLKRAARLRQSILMEAFEGNLVSQDPSDEPASVLLEQIRSDRNVGNGSGKPRRSKAPRSNKLNPTTPGR